MCHRIIIFSLFICILTACKGRMNVVDVKLTSFVDTAVYAILPYDSSAMMGMNWHYKDARPGVITPKGVDSLETIVDSTYKAFTKDSTAYLHKLMPLETYRRQYVALITADGEREVWVNFFCASFNIGWREHVVIVDDGGTCFFQLFINVKSGKASELIPNGAAFMPGSLVPYCKL